MIRYFKQNKALTLLTVCFCVVSSISYVFIAVLLQKILDAATKQDLSSFVRILVLSCVYFVGMGLLLYVHSYLSKKLICRIIQQVRTQSFAGMISHTIEDFRKADTSDYLSALTNDVKLVEEQYLPPLCF